MTIKSQDQDPVKDGKNLTGKQFAAILVAFFLTFASVDAFFVYSAATTHTGVTVDHAYKKGLAYNDTIKAAEEAEKLGWKVDVRYEEGRLWATVLQRDGLALQGAMVRAEITRPLDGSLDQRLPLNPVGEGGYNAAHVFDLKGQWDIRVYVKWQQYTTQTVKRIVVK